VAAGKVGDTTEKDKLSAATGGKLKPHEVENVKSLLETETGLPDRAESSLDDRLLTRVATRPGFPGMSLICAMLSRVPARPAPGRQMSRISRLSRSNVNKNNENIV